MTIQQFSSETAPIRSRQSKLVLWKNPLPTPLHRHSCNVFTITGFVEREREREREREIEGGFENKHLSWLTSLSL